MPYARVVVTFALVIAAAIAGCEAIVSTDTPEYTCSMTPYATPGNGTCPAGMYCKAIACAACETKDECDGYDNDCDGIIDDGLYSDRDGDGFTTCGKRDTNFALVVPADCKDDDKTVYPGATEVCNGKDDNCDGIIDNPDLVCPAGETCAPQSNPPCISNAAVCSPATCPAPNVCDPGTQRCVPPGTQDAGTTCSGDKACATGICSDPAELGPGQAGGTCTRPCCTSADCDPGSICWGAGTGGNYCLDATTAGRAPIGGGVPGAMCNVGGDCRSGVCGGGRCEDTCCVNANCTGGTHCAITTNFAGSYTTLACVQSGSVGANQSCTRGSDCQSGFCQGYVVTDNLGRMQNIAVCVEPCCSSTACGTIGGLQVVCADANPSGATSPVVPVCNAPQQGPAPGATPTGQVGDGCTSSTDCFSNLCNLSGTSGYCSDVCCVDADCHKAGWVCRPTPSGSGASLRCIPKP